MRGTAFVKVPNGKLVEVTVEFDEDFEDVMITGDFFLEPPSALEDLEAAIEGESVDAAKSTLASVIDNVDARLIGFDANDLAEAVREAVEV